jgi:hypothetical protein
MNIRNAWGFLSFGLVMGLLPLLAPTWFPPTGIDGSSARAMWLQLMGVVQTALGGVVVLGQFVVPVAIRWLAFVPPTPAMLLPFEQEAAEPEFDEASTAEAA